ncbi:MAG: methyltransferase [Taibaiella sp.]|nr:methyltransferase [Taibaiella sp.]
MSVRKRLQGVTNIIRFNWHFYVIGILLLLIMGVLWFYTASIAFRIGILILAAGIFWNLCISLLVSAYVYDWSGFYSLSWLRPYIGEGRCRVANIHAGFDETSGLIAGLHPSAMLTVYDFYDAARHTEVSIRRARSAYGPYPGTVQIDTGNPTLSNGPYDTILLLLAAHEIRDGQEAVAFFNTLRSQLAPGGRIIVVEHLRDSANFFAYTVGFFHFLSRGRWLRTFSNAGLVVERQDKINPFITLFCLADGTPR